MQLFVNYNKQGPDIIWKATNKVLNGGKQANDLTELVISDSSLSGTPHSERFNNHFVSPVSESH